MLGLIAVALVTTGCGRNPLGRLPVAGTVTLNAKTLVQGNIAFEPIDRQTGVGSGTGIVDGAFSIPVEKGLPPGTYIVRIYSTIPSKPAADDAAAGMSGEIRPGIQLIPPQYNSQSNLKIEISTANSQKLTFDVVTP